MVLIKSRIMIDRDGGLAHYESGQAQQNKERQAGAKYRFEVSRTFTAEKYV
jgi:hypothetical protein